MGKAPALSLDLDAADNHSRTVYGRVSRGRLNTVLALYDFPDPMMTAPRRELTTSPLQQLFVMNSPFMQERAAHRTTAGIDQGAPRPLTHKVDTPAVDNLAITRMSRRGPGRRRGVA